MFDLTVIGSGPGGYVAAIRAAQLGMKTALIEKRETFGGTCLNVGCIPSKSLLHSSELFSTVQNHAHEMGVEGSCSLNFSKMMVKKEGAVAGLVQGVAGLLKKHKVTTYHGTATFVDANTIEVDGKSGKNSISSKNILLATGSEPTPLPFLPFDEENIVSSTGALSLQEVPKELIVVGAGVIGVELASVYARLGSQVTIVELLDEICFGLDHHLSHAFLSILKKQGLQFYLGAKVLSGEVGKGRYKSTLKVEYGGERVELKGNKVLVAVGRRPYSRNLSLDAVGIQKDQRGFVPVNGNFQTSVPNIYAIGDLIEGPMLAHRASDEAIACVDCLAGKKAQVNYLAIPSVIYTSPEVASVGFTESEAKKLGLGLIVGKSYFRGNARARCGHESEGLVKVIGDKSTGRLLGLHILGPSASEMIGEGVICIEKSGLVHDLAYTPHAHPTLSETIKEAALAALGQPLHQ